MIGQMVDGAALRRKKVLVAIGAILTLFLAVAGIFFAPKIFDNDPYAQIIPPSIREQASFQLYHPTSLPGSHTVTPESVKLVDNTFFYEIHSSQGTIGVSQQPIPADPPELDKLEGFRKLPLPIGDAVIGKNAGSQTVIVLTGSTLIIVRGASEDISADTIGKIAGNLQPLKQ